MSLRSQPDMLRPGSVGSDGPLLQQHSGMEIDEFYANWAGHPPQPMPRSAYYGQAPQDYPDLPHLHAMPSFPDHHSIQSHGHADMMHDDPNMMFQGDNDHSSSGGPPYSSPSGSGSPPWSPPHGVIAIDGDGIDLSALTPPNAFSLELLQKPRGSNGRWLSVEPSQRLRVAAKLGKMLKIVIRTPLAVDWATMRLLVLERSVSGETNADEQPWRVTSNQKEAFSILSKTVLDNAENSDGQPVSAIQLDIKLFLVYRSISFLAEVSTFDGRTLRAISVSVSTHNSGSSDGKRKRDRITADTETDSKGLSPISPDEESFSPVANGHAAYSSKESHYMSVKTHDPALAHSNAPQLPMHTPHQVPQSYSTGYSNVPEITQAGADKPWQVVPGNLQVEGVVRAHGFSQFSDLRLKTDICDLAEAMQIVQQLSGKTYLWKKNTGLPAIDSAEAAHGGKRVIGLIAQEVQRVLPEVVQETDDGFLAVNYAELVPVLIEAFKEQVSHFQDVQQQVATTFAKHAGHQEDLLDELGKLSHHIHKLQQEKRNGKATFSADTSSSVEEETSSSQNEESSSRAEQSSPAQEPLVSKKSKHKRLAKQKVDLKPLIDGQVKEGHILAPDVKLQMSEPVVEASPYLSPLIKAVILVCLLALTVALVIFVGVYFGSNASGPRPPPGSFASKNYIPNYGFEDPSISDSTKCVGWDGDYSRHSYSLAKRSTLSNNWPLVSNASLYFDAGNYAVRTTIQSSSANQTIYSAATTHQQVNVAEALQKAAVSPQEISYCTGIAISVWVNTLYAPRGLNGDVESRNSPANGTVPAVTISAITRSKTGEYIGAPIYSFSKKLSLMSPYHWQQIALSVPINIESLGMVDISLSSSAIGDLFWDQASLYFVLGNIPPSVAN